MDKIRRAPQKRSRQFNIRVTDAELEALGEVAREYGYRSIAAFAREVIFSSDSIREMKLKLEEANE